MMGDGHTPTAIFPLDCDNIKATGAIPQPKATEIGRSGSGQCGLFGSVDGAQGASKPRPRTSLDLDENDFRPSAHHQIQFA